MSLLPYAYELSDFCILFDNSSSNPKKSGIKIAGKLDLIDPSVQWVNNLFKVLKERDVEIDKTTEENRELTPTKASIKQGSTYTGSILSREKHFTFQKHADKMIIHDNAMISGFSLTTGLVAKINYAYDQTGKLIAQNPHEVNMESGRKI